MVVVISATLVFVIVGGFFSAIIEDVWDPTLFGLKPRWLFRLKRLVEIVVYGTLALFLWLVLRLWLGHVPS
jgi:hypothetical protein